MLPRERDLRNPGQDGRITGILILSSAIRWGSGVWGAAGLMMSSSQLNDPETYSIIGAAMEVHRDLGRGFLESVYRSAMHLELESRRVPFQAEVRLPVVYKDHILPVSFRADLLCYGDVVVELKAVPALGVADLAQLGNYLRASRCSRGILLNFGASSLEYRRLTRGD